ncbi:MAG: hypothetical protein L0Z62_51205 [Gemmataceae bacterium]|nr:hypothetical protein [Gemmataceae bacterium]
MELTRTPARRERAERPAPRALVWAVSGLLACSAPAFANPPTPRVELWHGTQQVGSFPPLAAEETRPAPEQAPCEQGPTLPAPPLLDPALPATHLPREEKPGPVSTPGSVLSTQCVAPEAPGATAGKPAAATDAPAQPASTPAAPASVPTTPEREASTRGVASDLVFQVACVFGAAFLGPLVSAAVLLWLLRRHSKRSGALFRIEHVGGPANPSVEAMSILAAREALLTSPGWGGRLGEREGAPASPSRAAQATSAEAFQLGPTCEQEQQDRAAQAQDREQAMLQQFFEDNLRLQEQIERSRNADQ